MTDKREMFFDELNAHPFEHLIDFTTHPDPGLDEQSRAAIAQTMGYIGYMHRRMQAGEPDSWTGRRMLSFGTMAPRRFIELIEQGHGRVLVILAHFVALGKMINHFWCSHDVATSEIRRIHQLVPQGWQWAMKFPLEAVGLLRFDPVLEASRTV
ncbi:MAG: hypothetical protein Q9160_005756 [Pyrenula sp. 1 TL-2023]